MDYFEKVLIKFLQKKKGNKIDFFFHKKFLKIIIKLMLLKHLLTFLNYVDLGWGKRINKDLLLLLMHVIVNILESNCKIMQIMTIIHIYDLSLLLVCIIPSVKYTRKRRVEY